MAVVIEVVVVLRVHMLKESSKSIRICRSGNVGLRVQNVQSVQDEEQSYLVPVPGTCFLLSLLHLEFGFVQHPIRICQIESVFSNSSHLLRF